MNESNTFCSCYLSGIETRFTRDERNDDSIVEDEIIGDFEIFKQKVRPLGVSSVHAISHEEKRLFNWYTLNNVDEISEYHKKHLRVQRRQAQNAMNLYKRHERAFPEWFRAQVLELRESANLSNDFFSLPMRPSFDVRCYNGCIVGGLRFYTIELDSQRTTQNSGVMVISESDVSGSGDNNFYDVLDEVLHVQYPLERNVWLFKCRWYDTDVNKSQRTHIEVGYKSLNTSHFWYAEEPVILATQAHQVFYVDDPKMVAIGKLYKSAKTDAIFLEFEDELDNFAGGSSSVGDNAGSSFQQPGTLTPRRRAQSRLLELEHHVAVYGCIPMTITPGAEKPISPHVVRFSQAIGVFVEHQMLITFKEFRTDCHRHFKKYSDPEEARANPPNILVGRHEDWYFLWDHYVSRAFQHELVKKKMETIDRVELFRETHVRVGIFVSQAAEDVHVRY
ncbi:CACTA en-spm transposon protein [Cucumis melo var. makuwa]|uniref:CACTA en-spm transposon protein n=1 Tax=Cucumis melo var. makuwa TaxID=1194695 RepID=A0A5D3CXD1_CUCMM|nr:CACTA en-spm transposon protein [Cucumis melo var. makuwa]